MDSDSSLDAPFTNLMVRLKSGDPDVARQLFERYAQQLVGLARSRIQSEFRNKVDPEDVVQSVYRSFFRRHQEDQLSVSGWDNLWSLLALMTVRKCLKQIERFQTERRAVSRETSGDEAVLFLVDREPTPDEAAILNETVAEIFDHVDPEDRAIVELSLQGFTTPEISQQLNRAERTVRRLRERVRNLLQSRLEATAGAS